MNPLPVEEHTVSPESVSAFLRIRGIFQGSPPIHTNQIAMPKHNENSFLQKKESSWNSRHGRAKIHCSSAYVV